MLMMYVVLLLAVSPTFQFLGLVGIPELGLIQPTNTKHTTKRFFPSLTTRYKNGSLLRGVRIRFVEFSIHYILW